MPIGESVSPRDTSPQLCGCSPLEPGSTPPGCGCPFGSVQIHRSEFHRAGVAGYSLFAPKLSLRSGQKLVRRLLDHRLDRLLIHRLAFKSRGSLDQRHELFRLPLGLLPSQLTGTNRGTEPQPQTQGFGDRHNVPETRRSVAARQDSLNRRTRYPAPLREQLVAKAKFSASFIKNLEQPRVFVHRFLPPHQPKASV